MVCHLVAVTFWAHEVSDMASNPCRRPWCRKTFAEHTVYHDAPPDPEPPSGLFDFPTSGVYCPSPKAPERDVMADNMQMTTPDTSVAYDSRPETYEHIGVVRGFLSIAVNQLLDRANGHDASKLVDPERETFNEYTPKLKHSTFGSDEYKGFLVGMGEGLAHHYANNRHHPEHHADGVDGMNLIDLVEMICDWLAAVQRHDDGDIRRSIDINQARFGYDDQIKRILHNTVDALTGGSGG